MTFCSLNLNFVEFFKDFFVITLLYDELKLCTTTNFITSLTTHISKKLIFRFLKIHNYSILSMKVEWSWMATSSCNILHVLSCFIELRTEADKDTFLFFCNFTNFLEDIFYFNNILPINQRSARNLKITTTTGIFDNHKDGIAFLKIFTDCFMADFFGYFSPLVTLKEITFGMF